jgi:peptidoglycan/LPS O-acetylase OafA/YrhL
MIRERALKIVLVVVGLLFTAAIYPVAVDLWHLNQTDYGDDMALSLYFALGIFLLLAVRNPAGNRSLIAFTAWSSFAHGTVMLILAFHIASEHTGGLFAGGLLYLIGISLIALAPAKGSVEHASALVHS